MKKYYIFIPILCCLVCGASVAEAKATKIEEAVLSEYPYAVPSKGLVTAHYELSLDTIRSYVVLKRGGIPAERARFFIEWQEYDYRGVVVHLDKDDKITTRRGGVYTYLQRGDLMAVADFKIFDRTVYLKLISPEVYVPEGRQGEKRLSRVTVMLGFKFPKKVFREDDAAEVIGVLRAWLRPFGNFDEAKAYAAAVKEEDAKAVVEKEEEEGIKEKAIVESETGGKAVNQGEIKMKVLEDKIESAKRQMDEAEKEMKKLKEEMKKAR